MLEEYERSRMSGMAFAEQHGIKYTTLASWIQRKKKRSMTGQKTPSVNHPVQWVEAVTASPRQEEKALPLLVRFGGGVLMEIADCNGAMLAAQVLRHLGETR